MDRAVGSLVFAFISVFTMSTQAEIVQAGGVRSCAKNSRPSNRQCTIQDLTLFSTYRSVAHNLV